jgi:hypothetical protein
VKTLRLYPWDESESTLLKVLQLSNNTTPARIPMSEPDKVEERCSTDMSLYHLLRKAGNGLSDILPRECTPAEIKNSVAEAGKSSCEPCNSGARSPQLWRG